MLPSQAGQRLNNLDIIRGVIIFAILIININYFSTPSLIRYNPLAFGEFTQLDAWVWGFEYGLIKQRFMPLLALMFGAGIYLFSQKYESQNQSATKPYLLRTVALIAIGMIHGYLIWDGDVLVSYAICGIAAYFLRNLSNKILLILGLTLTLAPVAPEFINAWQSIGSTIENPPSWMPDSETAIKMQNAYNKSWLELTPGRIDTAIGRQTTDLIYFTFWRCTGLMLIGIVLMRSGFLLGKGNLKLLTLVTLALGLPISIISTYGYIQAQFSYQYFATYLSICFYLGTLLLAFAYLFLLIQWAQSSLLKPLQNMFAALGKMALTIYIMQSVICGFIFYGYGIGLHGQVSRTEIMLITIAIWGFQIVFASLWLKYFNQGPLEIVWRKCYQPFVNKTIKPVQQAITN